MTNVALPDSADSQVQNDTTIFGPSRITQTLVVAVGLISCAIFWYGAKAIGWPSEPHYGGSLLQPISVTAFITLILLLIGCTALGTLVLGRRWFLGGLMTATAGLATWSVRGGSMTYVLFRANSAGVDGAVFLQMLLELAILFAVIGGLWNFLWTRDRHPVVEPNVKNDGRSASIAITAQSALMTVLVLILTATPNKKQVLVSVFLSGLLATTIAEQFFADRKASRWYWIGPLVTGAFGYIAGYFAHSGMEMGDLSTNFGALARVLPLDYASVGCAGALLGHWWSVMENAPRPVIPV